jgi:large subunit ribosomal protein L24
MHVKKGDTVIVIAGNDKGKVGEIRTVIRETGRVKVAGVNLRWKHKRPTQQKPKGERVQEECSLHHSNVMLYDAETKKGTRKRKAEAKR